MENLEKVSLKIGDHVVEAKSVSGISGLNIVDDFNFNTSVAKYQLEKDGTIVLKKQRSGSDVQGDIIGTFFDIKSLADMGALYFDNFDHAKRDPQLCNSSTLLSLIKEKAEELQQLFFELECSSKKEKAEAVIA